MAISRAAVVDRNFLDTVRSRPPAPARSDLDAPVRPGTRLTARRALELFEAQVESRLLDLVSREMKTRGQSFYTIGSSGHECNAAVAGASRNDDMAFLHYRSGAFFLARANAHPGPEGAFDVLLGVTASAEEPIAGGRHKVFGSVSLNIPPQTSTIASQLPKALGYAVALDRRARFEGRTEDRIAICSFGDASANHATAVAAVNSAAWCAHQNVPAPVLFVCEDNGFGISVRTPQNWIARNFDSRPGLLEYFSADGRDLPSAWDAAEAAVDFVRTKRMPAFLHMKTVRLLGHAGSDVEQLYRTNAEIRETEAQDPVLQTALLLVDGGWLQPDEVIALYEQTRTRLRTLADEVVKRTKITTREQVMRPLAPDDPEAVKRSAQKSAEVEARQDFFGKVLPEQQERPRHLAVQLNRALADTLLTHPEAILFGEDVAKKGGVYHVTADLTKKFGVGRVFNTLLDETTILGLAIGAGHAGLLPLPEIQYLAYLMNAIDQLRGEAGSMQFFSNGQYANPMVLRIASLAYQKGFGGHFHNDNGIAALREIPGLLIACPSRGDDAVRMLRTLVAMAHQLGRPTVFLEPIALYMTKDLHEPGDGTWLTHYPPPGESLPVGSVGVYEPSEGPADLVVATYANGLWMTLRVARRLEAEGIKCRVIDLRWLAPLPHDALEGHAREVRRVLVVDECRRSSGVAEALVTELALRVPGTLVDIVVGADSYVPLGAAANLVLVQEDEIAEGIRRLAAREVS